MAPVVGTGTPLAIGEPLKTGVEASLAGVEEVLTGGIVLTDLELDLTGVEEALAEGMVLTDLELGLGFLSQAPSVSKQPFRFQKRMGEC